MRTLLMDSNFICHRAFYAVSKANLTNGVIYGFLSQVFTTIKKTKPDKVLFFWDSKRSLRKKIYPEYKAKRGQDKTEIEMEKYKKALKQFSRIRRQVLPEIGIRNSFMQPGYESDDLIASYVLSATDDEKMLIVSSDKDFYQLLSPNCSMFLLKQSDYYLYQDFLAAHKNLNPVLWADVKAIAGCPSDNIQGLVKIGEKRAIDMLLRDGPIDASKDDDCRKQGIEKLDLIHRNYKLTKLPFEGTIDIRKQVVDNAFSMKQFLRICREYEFHSFRKEDRREEIKELMSNI